MGSYAVKVIFKIAPATGNLPEECVAFIVSDLSSFPNYTCYAHVGQHGEASPEFFNECREATSDEWQELYNELVSIGYLPIIMNSKECWVNWKPFDRYPWLTHEITEREMGLPYDE